jgi:hypothetical protein
MTTRIKLRRDTAANWNTRNPVLAFGEPGYDTTNNKIKVGDGVTAWQDLDYLTDNTGGGGDGSGINFDADGAINLQGNGVVRNQVDSQNVNIVSNGFVQLQWTTDAGVAEPDPNGTAEPVNWAYVDSGGFSVETNINVEGQQSHFWSFDNNGNFNLPNYAKIGPYGMGWTGITNNGQQAPVTVAAISNNPDFLGQELSSVTVFGGANDDTAGTVNISAADLNGQTNQWAFNYDGSLGLPTLNNTGYQPFYNLNGPTLKLGVSSDQVIITGPTPTTQNPNAQRIVIQGQKGFGGDNQAGEGGDVYIWGGTGGEYTGGSVTAGDGGDIKLRGGAGQFGGNGGYVKIEGGDSFYGPGGQGGYVEINAGDHVDGSDGNGGSISIQAGRGQGSGSNGEIFLRTGRNRENQWQFNNSGILTLPHDNYLDASDSNLKIGSQATVAIRTNAASNITTKEWAFDTNGVLTLPAGGDIVDSNGDSVLGGTIPNTVKGWYVLQGRRPNNYRDVWFQSVVAVGNYVYTLGKNEYAGSWRQNVPVVQKIDKTTGEIVWSKRIVAGHEAQFEITVTEGVASVSSIMNPGLGYKAGESLILSGDYFNTGSPQGNMIVAVTTVDTNTGAITGAIIGSQPTNIPVDGVYSNISVLNDNNNIEPYSITYDMDGEQLVVVCRTNRGAWSQEDSFIAYVDVYLLDELTGAVNNTYTLKDAADIEATSVAVNNTGLIALVGQKYNEYRNFGPLTILASGNGYFDILKSNLDAEHYPDSGIPGDEYYNFFIQGTGIAYQKSVDGVNYYQNVPTTVREGSGTVTVDVVCDGTGPYTYGAVTVQAGGTNYRVGHKIKYLGTQLGGATPANDLILTVTGVDGSGAITAATASGAAPSGGIITGLTAGTNYQVGSGAAVNITVSPSTGLITNVSTGNFGDYHYVIGDVLTVAGTTFANGTSPANDITLTVTEVFFNGPNAYDTPIGTVPSDALRFRVDGVNFTGGGSWTMRQTLGGEAFVWTPNWNKAIGGSVNDWFNSVSFSPDGNSIYAVGQGRYEVTYNQALVVKFNASTGDIVWSKYVNSYLTPNSEGNAEAMSVVTLTSGNIVVATGNQDSPESGRQEHTLVCLDASGALQWAKSYIEPDYYFNNWYKLVRDAQDNLYFVYTGGNGDGSDSYTIVKVDSANGDKLWARSLSNGNNGMYFGYNWSNNYVTVSGTDLFIVGYTYIPNDNYYSGLLIKFPTDGFKNFTSTGYQHGEQFGDLRLYEPVIESYSQTQAPATFVPGVHANGIQQTVNDKAFATETDNNQAWSYIIKMTRDDLGYLEFGDGSKQSFATDKIPQILGSYNQNIKLSAQDSGKHFFFDQNCSYATIHIPPYDVETFPVGFTVTIVNMSGNNIYVNMDTPANGDYWWGTIKGSGRNISTRQWGIPDSGSGSLVTLMKVKNAEYTGGENESGDIWIIAGPNDLYDNN